MDHTNEYKPSRRDARLLLLIAAICLTLALIVEQTDVAARQRFVPVSVEKMAVEPVRAENPLRVLAEPVEPELISLGTFTAYAYCPCTHCCGQWAWNNLTASGTTPTEGRTIAADWDVLPAGTEVYIDGHQYTVEDTGTGIDGNALDVFVDSHAAALEFGVQQVEATTKAPPTGVEDPSAASENVYH